MQAKEQKIKLYFKKIIDILYLDFDKDQKEAKAEEIYNKVKNGKILFVQPNFNNHRISNQNGLLSVPTSLNSSILLKQLIKNCSIIRINKELRNDIDFILKSVGINGYKMMPDLQHACENIKSKQINEILEKFLENNNL